MPVLATAIAGRGRDELLDALRAVRVPCGPINAVAEVFAEPQLRHRGMAIEVDGVPGVRTPIRFSGATLALDRRSPRLGEHDAEVRAGLEGSAGTADDES